MVTKAQVRALLGGGLDYRKAAEQLGVPPGQAYLIATGRPADGSDGGEETAEEADRPQANSAAESDRAYVVATSTQVLVNPRVESSTTSPLVRDWMSKRALADAPMQAANAGHSVRPPEPDLPDEPELLDELRRQRSQITYVVKELKALPPPSDDEPLWYGDRRRAALALLAERSAELAAVQEDVLWPLAERSLPDGRQWQQRARELDAAGQTRELAAQGPEAEGFADRLTDVLGRCRRQTALEDALYLQLGESVPEEERRALGRRVRSGGHDGEEQSA